MNGDNIKDVSLVNGETDIMTASYGKQQIGDSEGEGRTGSDSQSPVSNNLSNGSSAVNNMEGKENTSPDKSSHKPEDHSDMEVDDSAEKDTDAGDAVPTNKSASVISLDSDNETGDKMETDDAVELLLDEPKSDKKENHCDDVTEVDNDKDEACKSNCKESDVTEAGNSEEPQTAMDTNDKEKPQGDLKDCEPEDSKVAKTTSSHPESKPSPSPNVSRSSTPVQEVTSLLDSSNEASPSVTPSIGDSCVSTPAGSRSSTPSQVGSNVHTPVPPGRGTPQPETAGGSTPGPSPRTTPTASAAGPSTDTTTPGSSAATTPTPTAGPSTSLASQPAKQSKIDRLLPMVRKASDLRPMADLLVGIGQSLVSQQVYKDLVRVQRKKKLQRRLTATEEKQLGDMEVLYDSAVELNQPFHMDEVQCARCGFHSESDNVLEVHKEFAHMGPGDVYLCSFCTGTTKNINSYFDHMVVGHKRKGRIHMKMSPFVCPMCPYDHSSRNVFTKHLIKCSRNFNAQRNLEPRPADSDIPLKKMKFVPASQPKLQAKPQTRPTILKHYQDSRAPTTPTAPFRATGKTVSSLLGDMRVRMPYTSTPKNSTPPNQPRMIGNELKPRPVPPGMTISPSNSSQPQYVQLGGNFYCLMMHNGRQMLVPVINPSAPAPGAPLHSAFTPRVQSTPPQRPVQGAVSVLAQPNAGRGGLIATPTSSADPGFQVCEICGGFVKDRESLRVHFFWAHRTDISKEVFYGRKPSLICARCPERFWTAQGLSRHQRTKHAGLAPSPAKPVVTKYTCIVCNQTDLTDILDHLQSVHGISLDMQVNMKTCMVCGKALSTEAETKLHLTKQHPGIGKKDAPKAVQTPPKAAAEAAKRPNTVAALMAQNAPTPGRGRGRAVGNRSEQPYCPQCRVEFQSVSQYLAHRHAKHTFLCPRCPIKNQYTTINHMHQHYYKSHHGELDLCPICTEKIPWGPSYIAHITQKHLKKCSVNIKRMSAKELQKHEQQLRQRAPAQDEEVFILEESTAGSKPGPLHSKLAQLKRANGKKRLHEEIIEVDGEQVIVQQQESDSD